LDGLLFSREEQRIDLSSRERWIALKLFLKPRGSFPFGLNKNNNDILK
jgi:hypothetical protein